MSWQEIWKGTASDGRKVTAKQNDDGDIRVTTTTSADDDGYVKAEEGSTTIMPPTPAGSKIDIDPDPGQSLDDALMNDGGFGEADARSIAGQIRKAAGL